MLEHDMKDQIVDTLHLAKLNLPKIPWKHGLLNNMSDDAREEASEYLKSIGAPLDCRRKDDGRQRADKWHTGEKWAS
eukprot:2838695-Prymnesium_polylepis.1